MSVEETASALGIRKETVKTRFFRARRLLREELGAELAAALGHSFPFAGARCDRLVAAVLQRLVLSVNQGDLS
jgi:RNA polymerase sigma-70 factor (ECF subfamily)